MGVNVCNGAVFALRQPAKTGKNDHIMSLLVARNQR